MKTYRLVSHNSDKLLFFALNIVKVENIEYYSGRQPADTQSNSGLQNIGRQPSDTQSNSRQQPSDTQSNSGRLPSDTQSVTVKKEEEILFLYYPAAGRDSKPLNL